MFHVILLRCDTVDQGAHIRERLTANRSDLTLQCEHNQHGTHMSRRTTRTNHSPPHLELQEPAQRHMVSRAQCETTKIKHMHPHFSATTQLPQELGAGSCTFEARQYSAYRFRSTIHLSHGLRRKPPGIVSIAVWGPWSRKQSRGAWENADSGDGVACRRRGRGEGA